MGLLYKEMTVDVSKIWFTGDQHFCHANIIIYCKRPWLKEGDLDSEGNWVSNEIANLRAEEMNEVMIERWNEVIKEEDTVYHVGDFGLSSYDKLKEIFDKLNGRKIIIRGNHDRSRTSLTKMGWEVYNQPFVLDGMLLTHTPIVDTHDWSISSCYANTTNICGHIHEKWKIKGNSYNAGVDVHDFRPISLKELLKEK